MNWCHCMLVIWLLEFMVNTFFWVFVIELVFMFVFLNIGLVIVELFELMIFEV